MVTKYQVRFSYTELLRSCLGQLIARIGTGVLGRITRVKRSALRKRTDVEWVSVGVAGYHPNIMRRDAEHLSPDDCHSGMALPPIIR